MPEKCSSGCLRHHPVTGQLSSRLLTILGWRRPGKKGSANTKPRDESRGVSVSINPRPCHSEPVTDVTGVGIRNLLAGNLRKSAGIMRFGNGLPRQCAHWLGMTGERGGQGRPPLQSGTRAARKRDVEDAVPYGMTGERSRQSRPPLRCGTSRTPSPTGGLEGACT